MDRNARQKIQQMVQGLLKDAGWQVSQELRGNARRVDMVARRKGDRLGIEIGWVSRGRQDELRMRLAQTILHLKRTQELEPTMFGKPVAIVAAPRIPGSVAEQLLAYAAEEAPEVIVGIVDLTGMRRFRGGDLDGLSSGLPQRKSRALPAPARLFTDLNCWLMKILIGQAIPSEYLFIPRGTFDTGIALATAAEVSAASAARFTRRMEREGFLDPQAIPLRVHRVSELLDRWSQSVGAERQEAIPAWWILPGGEADRLLTALKLMQSKSNPGWPRYAIGRASAARALQLGRIEGLPEALYVDSLTDTGFLRQIGLSLEARKQAPDVALRVPRSRESVFRGAVRIDGVPVTDVLQIWADLRFDGARGDRLAEQVWGRVIGAALGEELPDGR